MDAEFHHLLFDSNYERLIFHWWDAADQEKFGRLLYGYNVKWGLVLWFSLIWHQK